MNDWLSLETRFREISKLLPSLRLDIQTGADGEHFNLTGDSRNSNYRQMVSLCSISGKLLKRSLGKGAKALDEPDDLIRWFRFMKDCGPYQVDTFGTMRNADGTSAGSIALGRILGFCDECANLCLELEAKYPVRDERGFWERLHANYGRDLIVGTTVAVVTALVTLFLGLG